ncbi:hypothetical protein [Streptomyces sp. NPDC048277]|uniref:hypothetical protein n=1 Tax=Streptomyces sp. NPDC048277 TaxID=3155027 RepID=UPI0033FE381B
MSSDDPSGPAAAGTDTAGKIPGRRFALVESAGHRPQWEQAARFDGLVPAFLAEGRRPGGPEPYTRPAYRRVCGARQSPVPCGP